MLGVLGRGGFGTVYRAELLGEGAFVRPVALKVLNPSMDGVATVAARLRDEARMLGRIRHRALVQVDGLVRLDDRWTVVMEYVEGVDLGWVVSSGGAPARCVLEVVGEVASALHVAHHWTGDDGRPLGLLHRDIKPANVLLTAIGEVKIVDFGTSRATFAEREARTYGMRFGSPGYVAPERIEGVERPEGDVYSLGVLAYELLAGRKLDRPVRRDRAEAHVRAALDGLTVAPEVVQLVREMVSWDADDRPATREVERRCRALVARLDGPFLRDWAEHAVPPLLLGRTLGDATGDFSSELVYEGVPPPASVPPPPTEVSRAPSGPPIGPSFGPSFGPSIEPPSSGWRGLVGDVGLLGLVVVVTVLIALVGCGGGFAITLFLG